MPASPDRSEPFRTRLDAFRCEILGVEEGRIESLHRMRVASRRLRELLPLLEFDRRTTRKLKRRLRGVTTALGAVRELDVLVGLVEDLRKTDRYSSAALDKVGAAIGEARAAARAQLAAELPRAKLERLADRLAAAVECFKKAGVEAARTAQGPSECWVRTMEARLADRAARLQSAIDDAGSLYTPGPLHDVRIALKKLRYAVELVGESGREPMTAVVAALKASQDMLGRLHDLQVLLAWGRDVEAMLVPTSVWRELEFLLRAIEDDCRGLHARYVRERAALMAIADQIGMQKLTAMAAARR